MSHRSQVQCDECSELFNIDLVEEMFPNKVIKTYFNCPYCDREYLIHFTDEWCREEQIIIKQLKKQKDKRRRKLLNRMDEIKRNFVST